MKRLITEDEERCYRLRHHNFAGFTTGETAKIMGIPTGKIRRLLKGLKAKAPQLFPIITSQQFLIYQLYVDKGLSQHKIATYLHTTQSSISAILNRIKKKGMFFPKFYGLGDTVTYENGMDNHILWKF